MIAAGWEIQPMPRFLTRSSQARPRVRAHEASDLARRKTTMTKKDPGIDASRRRLLAGIAAAPAMATLASCSNNSLPTTGSSPAPLGSSAGLPDPAKSGIDHIVVVMMENRSFDHMLGWVPGADGHQAGLKFKDSGGALQDSFRLSQNDAYGFQGCNFVDPDHGYDGGRIEFNKGAMDGFLLTSGTGGNPGDHFPIGYYTADDLPFYKGCADNWTICDRYFSGILSATLPNRMYMHAGQTDRNENTLNTSSLPTIWDLLAAKGLKGMYYAPDLPITALWGTKYLSITQPFDVFLVDAAAGNLADVTFVDPAFGGSVGEGPGISRDDHPHADVRDGQDFLNSVYNALRSSPKWANTLMIVNYDEWGGFFDHVPPPLAPVSDEERNSISPQGNDGRLGMRVPCVLIGPRAKKAHVEHMQFDPNSILNFICWRFGLPGLGVRASTSNNIAYALDFANAPRTDAAAFDVPMGPFGSPCVNQIVPAAGVPLPSLAPVQRAMVMHQLEMSALRNLALRNGFAIGPGFR
jgi:phospholipase C